MLAIALLLLVPSSVRADGFAIYTDRSSFALHSEETQVAAINYENGREKLLLAVKLRELEDSSVVWIIPVPANASDVKINILKEFPRFYGSDILLLAGEARKDAVAIASHSFIFTSISQIYTFPLLFYWVGGLTATFAGDGGVEVHTHIEKEGIVSEVVTAEHANALHDYLEGKNITIPTGSISVIDDYIGKTYSFVVSWVRSIEEGKMPAIFVDFPTDEIYYPLKPTSVYGDARIPVLIYVVGYAELNTYATESFTECRYFTGGVYGESLREFLSVAKPSSGATTREIAYVKYTRIMIGSETGFSWTTYSSLDTPPSASFLDDLWIEKLDRPPAHVEKALLTLRRIGFIRGNILFLMIGWLIVASFLAGGLTSYLVFRDFKKFALIGLANCFTIGGIIIATFVFDELKEKRVRFIGFFSWIFLLIDLLIIPAIVAVLIL